jgi:hypothetical protein
MQLRGPCPNAINDKGLRFMSVENLNNLMKFKTSKDFF